MSVVSVSSSDQDQKARRSTQRESAPWTEENDEIRMTKDETSQNDEGRRAKARGVLFVLGGGLRIRTQTFIRHSEFAICHFHLLPHLFW
jgi:hypothetical protein